MCDPTTALIAAGLVLSTAGAIQQSVYNTAAASNAASSATAAATYAEDRQRDQVKRLLASQQASWGASGVAGDSGSPLDVAADSAAQGKLDQLAIRYGGQVQANAARAQGAAAASSLPGTLLSGVVNAGSAYYALPKSDPTSTVGAGLQPNRMQG